MTAVAPSSAEMLSGLTQCAYRLALAFGAEAERAVGPARLDAYDRFERCFFSIRVAIGLQLRLRREGAGAGPAAEAPEREREADDSRERSDYLAPERDRDRDREGERASLPLLLKTLNSVVADAETLPGPPPAALPTLRELLAGMAVTPAPTRPRRTSGDLRSRLTTSASTPVLTPGLRVAPQPRQATGPPRR